MARNSTSSSQSISRSTIFLVQPVDAEDDENIRVLHRNMFFPVQSVTDPMMKNEDKHFALMKAYLLMDLYFDD